MIWQLLPEHLHRICLHQKSDNIASGREYRGGVFYQYVNIASVRISKGGQYYESDLSKGGSSTEPAAIGSGSEIPISAVSLNGNVVTKAQTGTYLLELKFYPSDGQKSTSLATTTDIWKLPTVRQIQ